MTEPHDPSRPPPLRRPVPPPEHGGPPIAYATPYGYAPPPTPGGLSPVALFFGGLGAGFLLSLAVWGVAYLMTNKQSSGDGWMYAGIAVLAVKVIASVVLLCKPGWRLLGGGLLTSVALGFLTCGFAFVSAVCGPPSSGM